MLSSMRRALLITTLLLVVGCDGRTTTTTAVAHEEVINVDSLLEVMDARYNQLCAERKVAYSERDPELRREFLERNDAACRALDDSLKWAISLKGMELTR